LRLHRKIVVIDDEIAYTGSFNLVDPRFFKQEAGVGQWVDAMARIEGPAVLSLNAVFMWDWEVETGRDLKALPDPAKMAIRANQDPAAWHARPGKERFIENLVRLCSPLL
jgi:phosphatidylserine/phosphatidylglycerophosphate/cardiolipin synthase-like enzyme